MRDLDNYLSVQTRRLLRRSLKIRRPRLSNRFYFVPFSSREKDHGNKYFYGLADDVVQFLS